MKKSLKSQSVDLVVIACDIYYEMNPSWYRSVWINLQCEEGDTSGKMPVELLV
jgi:hypothetical protein